MYQENWEYRYLNEAVFIRNLHGTNTSLNRRVQTRRIAEVAARYLPQPTRSRVIGRAYTKMFADRSYDPGFSQRLQDLLDYLKYEPTAVQLLHSKMRQTRRNLQRLLK